MKDKPCILLSTAYFAPIRYFSILAAYHDVFIEQHEHFIKQTYRNRTIVLGANGPVPLIVPVQKGRGQKVKIRDLRISYDEEWQRTHWRTIFSAYNSSPFFEYYADEIEVFFRKKYEFIFDFNFRITESILELLDLPVKLQLTSKFESAGDNCLNFREKINPKPRKSATDNSFIPVEYTQVFSQKFGFVPDLSVLDLLFNEGPSALSVLGWSYAGQHLFQSGKIGDR